VKCALSDTKKLRLVVRTNTTTTIITTATIIIATIIFTIATIIIIITTIIIIITTIIIIITTIIIIITTIIFNNIKSPSNHYHHRYHHYHLKCYLVLSEYKVLFVIMQKNRSTIPCLWEAQPSGCMKSYCPFLHTKRKNMPTSQAPHQAQPIRPPVASTAGQGIPTLASNPHMGTILQQGHSGVGRGAAGMRPHMYNGPPGPNMPPNQGPYMSGPRPMHQRPMGYEGFIPHSQPSHPMMYQMHHNSQSRMAPMPYPMAGLFPNMMMSQPRGDYAISRRTPGRDEDSDDDYTSSDFSDVSISDDERKARPRESSHRRVQSPRHMKNRREVRQRSDKGRDSSRSSRETHNDRKNSRRKYDSEREKEREKEKERNRKESDRSRNKPRKHNEDKESSYDKKKSESSPEKTKAEANENKDDIKVKSLEEILREKALKNLHERTAQKKRAQLEAEKAKKEDNEDNENNSDSPEPMLKSVVSVSKAESTSSQKVSETHESDEEQEVEFIREKRERSPNTIILGIIDTDTSPPAQKTIREVKVESDESKTEKTSENEEKESVDEAPATEDSTTTKSSSYLSKIKIKTFEEIMEEKRQRKCQESNDPGTQDVDTSTVSTSTVYTSTVSTSTVSTSAVSTSAVSTSTESCTKDIRTVIGTKPVKTRRITRVVKKATADGNKVVASEPSGKALVRRKVETTARKVVGDVGKEVPSQDIQEEKTKENKKNTENQNQKETPSNIVIKSFDEIMREKRQRRQQGQAEKTEPAQPSQEPTTIRRPTIIRKKPISTQPTSGLLTKSSLSEPSSPGRSEPASPDIISQSVAEPSSPGKSEPDSPDIITQSVAEPSSHQSHENMLSRTVRQIKDPSFHPTHKAASLEDETGSPPCVSVGDADDSDDDDDDSWEHEELPAVPLLTPTLESPAEIPDNLSSDSHKASAVLRIPGMTTQAKTTQGHVSPTKRPRSSLEELFGVPCDEADSKPDKEILSEKTII
ncbi:hypothetical protein QZH41_015870, partial [Actinostola sp. cb2023]